MKILQLLLLLSIFSACTQQAKNNPIETLSVTDSISVYVGLPTVMRYCDGELFIVDMFDEDKLVKIVDTTTKELIFSFATKGEGPNEYLHIGDVDLYTGKDNRLKIGLYDPMSSRMGIYDCDSLLTLKEKYIPAQLHFSGEGIRLHELLKIDEGYLATGNTISGKYILLSDSLEIQSLCGDYRPKPASSIPDMSHVIANHGKTVVSDDKDLFVELIYNASVLSCFDIKQQQLTKRWEQVIHELDYKLEGESVINKRPMGYLSASIGQKKYMHCIPVNRTTWKLLLHTEKKYMYII